MDFCFHSPNLCSLTQSLHLLKFIEQLTLVDVHLQLILFLHKSLSRTVPLLAPEKTIKKLVLATLQQPKTRLRPKKRESPGVPIGKFLSPATEPLINPNSSGLAQADKMRQVFLQSLRRTKALVVWQAGQEAPSTFAHKQDWLHH